MSLKLLNNEEKILFLQDFTAAIILNLIEDEKTRQLIEAERIKIKYLQPPEIIGPSETKLPSLPLPEPLTEKKATKKFVKKEPPLKIIVKPVLAHPKFFQKQFFQPQQIKQITQKPTIPQTISGENPLKKLDFLINDPAVQIIECSGPGKNVLVKARNKINTTKTILSEEEIRNIINYFSETTKIPLKDGFLRVAIGMLLFTGIISNFGSKFTINKKSPYELIEGIS